MTSAPAVSRRWGACCVLTVCGWLLSAGPGGLCAAEAGGAQPSLREVKDAAGKTIAMEAAGLPEIPLRRLGKQPDAQEALARVLNVLVDDPAVGQTAIVGSYATREGALRFTPRFAFRAGQAYRAVLRWPELEASPAMPGRIGSEVVYRFQVPSAVSSLLPEVTAIFPSAAVVPENQLRFYIHFSTPMARGTAYRHVQLLDHRNRRVDLPFLELGEELWDPRQMRLTLLIDPGRIKRGVMPREKLGTVLHAGESFTLVVDRSWPDAQGRPLRGEFAKHFQVGPPIERAIDPAQWQLRIPAEGSEEPLAIEFPRPLDRALLERLLSVRTLSGQQLEGIVRISQDEQRWELRPNDPWPAGRLEVVVDRALEDLAGNRIGRAFEVDTVGPITQQIESAAFHREFEIPAQP